MGMGGALEICRGAVNIKVLRKPVMGMKHSGYARKPYTYNP